MPSLKSAAGSVFRFLVRAGFVLLVFPVLYMLEPYVRLRFGLIYTNRIGHLSANTDVYLRRFELKPMPPRTHHFLFAWDPCNRQLFRMIVRRTRESGHHNGIHVYESRWGTRLVFACSSILRKTRFWLPLPFNSTEYFLYNNTKPVFAFTAEELRQGERSLRAMGIGENDWFVCFHARDSAYLHWWRPHLSSHWEKLDFKNNDILNYMKAVEHITALGGFAIRMGAKVESPLPDIGNPRIIDYATTHRSDFMDIYLSAKCRFFLGTGCGLAQVPAIFGTPLIVVDHFPYNHSFHHDHDIIVPRPIFSLDGMRRIPFWEAEAAGYYAWPGESGTNSLGANRHLYTMGLNSPDDILVAVKDMIDQLEGRRPSIEGQALRAYYAERYLSHHDSYRLAAKVSWRWALDNRDIILRETQSSTTEPGDRIRSHVS